MDAQCADTTVEVVARNLPVSKAGYYAWRKRRHGRTPSRARQVRDDRQVKILTIHKDSDGTYGSPRITADLHASGERVSANPAGPTSPNRRPSRSPWSLRASGAPPASASTSEPRPLTRSPLPPTSPASQMPLSGSSPTKVRPCRLHCPPPATERSAGPPPRDRPPTCGPKSDNPLADGTSGSGTAVSTVPPLGPMAALTNPIWLGHAVGNH